MSRIDLDAIQEQVEAIDHDRRHGVLLSAEHVAAWYLDDVPALVAELRSAQEELRAAWQVIGVARTITDRAGMEGARWSVGETRAVPAVQLALLHSRIAAYDKVTGEQP